MQELVTGFTAYDPSKVTLILGGWSPRHFAADSKIVIAKEGNINAKYVGTDGDVSIAIQRNKTGTMTINLHRTSPDNEVLCAFVGQGYSTTVVGFPVVMNDPKGYSINTIGWIEQQPEDTISAEVTASAWVIGLLDASLTRDVSSTALNTISGLTF